MTLPTFLIIGAMKAGTTSLYEYVRSHPDVFMPQTKELDFFIAEKGWQRGLAWYRSQFAPGAHAAARGEASPNYSKNPIYAGVPARIAEMIPQVRLVYVVRHPIERMRAHFLHSVSLGRENLPFRRAVVERPGYFIVSCYARQIDDYLPHFDRSQLLVITAEDLRADRTRTLKKVFAHIGVDASWSPPELETEHHTTSWRAPRHPAFQFVERLPARRRLASLVPQRIRRAYGRRTILTHDSRFANLPREVELQLRERLRPDVERLRSYLDEGFDGWGIG